MYKEIDLETYPRKEHFKHFIKMQNPFITMTINIDITDWFKRLKENEHPFFLSFQYALVRAANEIPEFRRRILNNKIIEYSFCNPSYTVMLPDETYRYCVVNVNQPFNDYLEDSEKKQEMAKKAKGLTEEGDTLGLLFITCTPWINYVALETPFSDNTFSIPSFAWGKYKKETKVFLENGQLKEKEIFTLPLTIMVHHALMDGIHIEKFLKKLNDELREMF